MQFKYPELLWGLLLLLIPIIVHLLQLRKFKKTPFTNVAMLQRVVSESRKSQNLKKWLLLVTRLLLLTSLVLAFAQPFFSDPNALIERETVVYLDNSFSMQAKKDGIGLLTKAIQGLIQEIPEATMFSLFTNDQTYRNVNIKQIQNDLLGLDMSSQQMDLDQIQLKAASLFSNSEDVIKNLLLLSDFQNRNVSMPDLNEPIDVHVVQPEPDNSKNVSIDSLYLGDSDGDQIPLNIQVMGLEEEQTVPLSVYDGDRLIAKTAVKGGSKESATTTISLQKQDAIKGRVSIEDPVLGYDNQFFFSIDERKPPKVLAISEEEVTFLERLFQNDEFNFSSFDLRTLDYSILSSQNTIILNGLKSIPSSLQPILLAFSKNGGTLVVIPSMKDLDLASYSTFFNNLIPLKYEFFVPTEQEISSISFEHPLYKNVFEKEVTNFDYPKVKSYYKIASRLPQALSYGDFQPFLTSYQNCYVFSGSLHFDNSNFINSPLVVPTFYNIAERSLKNPDLYHTIGKSTIIDISTNSIEEENIIKLIHSGNEFIPLQQTFSNKVRLQFEENPKVEGIYSAFKEGDTLQNISFNYPRNESELKYLDVESLQGITVHETIPALFDELQEKTNITDYWKWFVIFALLFAVLELLIQKWLP